jgi:hypothetical protein
MGAGVDAVDAVAQAMDPRVGAEARDPRDRRLIVSAYERPLSLSTIGHRQRVVPDVVQRLVGHPAGERAVAHDGDGAPTLGVRSGRSGHASPAAHDSAVDACEFSTMSCSDSSRDG